MTDIQPALIEIGVIVAGSLGLLIGALGASFEPQH